jgi:hypothetical protein
MADSLGMQIKRNVFQPAVRLLLMGLRNTI